jgi:hypothetical protein
VAEHPGYRNNGTTEKTRQDSGCYTFIDPKWRSPVHENQLSEIVAPILKRTPNTQRVRFNFGVKIRRASRKFFFFE